MPENILANNTASWDKIKNKGTSKQTDFEFDVFQTCPYNNPMVNYMGNIS